MSTGVIVWIILSGLGKLASIYATIDPQLTQALKELSDLVLYVAIALHITPAPPAVGPSGPAGPGIWDKIKAWLLKALQPADPPIRALPQPNLPRTAPLTPPVDPPAPTGPAPGV